MIDSSAPAAGDQAAIAATAGVVSVHHNTTSWYNNASFALPLLATVVAAIAGALLRNVDWLAFAGFLLAVTLLMIPVVLTSWRHTATAVVLTRAGISALHNGRRLQTVPWRDVIAIERRETQGNVRWLVQSAAGEHVTLEGELNDIDGLLRTARGLAGLPDEK